MDKTTQHQVLTLPSGMRLLLMPMKGIQSLSILAMVGVGSRFESKEKAGISHFLEHLPFKGTAHYPTPMAVAEAIDGIGGKHNAFTSKEYTGYWVKIASDHWERGLDVVSDLLLTPKLDPQDIERERGVIIEEINMYEDEPRYKVASLYDELVFSGSPLSMDTAGTKETVKGMTRDDFVEHYQTWYDLTNVVVGIVGDMPVNHDKIVERVTTMFAKGDSRKGGGMRVVGAQKQTQPRVQVFYKATEQAHFYLGYPTVGWDDERRYPLAMLSTLLGGNSSSRLFNEIREKRGLAYYAYATSDFYQEQGSLFALEGVAVDKIEEAIKVTLEEFNKAVQVKALKKTEVERAKEYLIGKMVLDAEDSANMAIMAVRKLLQEGKVETLTEIEEKIRKVSLKDVMEVAQEFIVPERLNLALVGPYKDEEKFHSLVMIK